MKIQIVNEQDELIGYKERKDATMMDIRRITSLWLTNSKWEILIARRALKKSIDPGLWGPAVAGTLEQGETYESNIQKETQEELGLSGVKFKEKWKDFYEVPHHARRFRMEYSAVCDWKEKDFVLQTEEVAEVKRISPEKLREWFLRSPQAFLPSFWRALKRRGVIE